MAQVMRIAWFSIWSLAVAGCTITTTPSTSDGGGGTGGSLCVMACAKLDGLMCPSTVQGDCATHCGMYTHCRAQEDVLAQCLLGAPVMCDASGNASTDACNSEGIAFNACAFLDGGTD